MPVCQEAPAAAIYAEINKTKLSPTEPNIASAIKKKLVGNSDAIYIYISAISMYVCQ